MVLLYKNIKKESILYSCVDEFYEIEIFGSSSEYDNGME